jgi:glycosyltransferase involved in cell wall biosynthesis
MNGALYLSEQLESIEKQTIPVSVLASDDGSTDETRTILETHNIPTVLGPCEGPAANFFSLIQNAPVGDFYALSDQDDIWDPEKIEVGVNQLKNLKGPALYLSSVRTQTGKILTPRDNKCPEYILSNNAMGCTMILNRDLVNVIKAESIRWSDALMHDWWIHLLASEVGFVVYDKNPHMTYRLHSMNHTGIPSLIERVRRFFFALSHPGSKKNVIRQFKSVQSVAKSSLGNTYSFVHLIEVEEKSWARRLNFVCHNSISKKPFSNGLLKLMIIFGAYS